MHYKSFIELKPIKAIFLSIKYYFDVFLNNMLHLILFLPNTRNLDFNN